MHAAIPPVRRDDIFVRAVGADAIAAFDFSPPCLVPIADYVAQARIATVPGTVADVRIWKSVFAEIDALLFVVDDRRFRLAQNVAALLALGSIGSLRDLPLVFYFRTSEFRDGLSSAALGDFLGSAAATWGLAAGLAGPLFTFGAIEGQVQSAEAVQREAVATYQQVVLNAFVETNDALVGTAKKREESGAQAKRVAALREFARLAKRKFDNGYADYLEVLFAENELFAAELVAVRTRIDSYTQLIAVYKAMGGGWVDQAAKLAPAPQSAASSVAR